MPSTGPSVRWVDYIGLRLIADVNIEIGGQQIDKHYSDFMYIWNELSLPVGKRNGYDAMVGKDLSADDGSGSPATLLHVPLEFWFCRNVGLALPLIALTARAEKHPPSWQHEEKLSYGSRELRSKKSSKVLVGFSIRKTCDKLKLIGKPLKPKGYQGRCENIRWLRTELRYGKNSYG